MPKHNMHFGIFSQIEADIVDTILQTQVPRLSVFSCSSLELVAVHAQIRGSCKHCTFDYPEPKIQPCYPPVGRSFGTNFGTK